MSHCCQVKSTMSSVLIPYIEFVAKINYFEIDTVFIRSPHAINGHKLKLRAKWSHCSLDVLKVNFERSI